MWHLSFPVFLLLVTASLLPIAIAATCEETETAHVKLELAKQSIINAKILYPKCQDETNNSSNCSIKDRSLAYLNAALDLISDAKLDCTSCPESKVIPPQDPQEGSLDCSDILSKGFKKSGVYKIYPSGVKSNKSIDAYCDMEKDGGGWTVIQRRGKFANQTDFYQDWDTYKHGFGDVKQEFWLGNENIFHLTSQRNYSVRFNMVDVQDEYRYAEYGLFSIGDENSGYVLNIKNHSGNATNDMQQQHDGWKFSTKDKQNDGREAKNSCAKMYHSAFWFSNGCGYVNLNGVYQPGKTENKSIWWWNWKRTYECLQFVEIKIRHKNF